MQGVVGYKVCLFVFIQPSTIFKWSVQMRIGLRDTLKASQIAKSSDLGTDWPRPGKGPAAPPTTIVPT